MGAAENPVRRQILETIAVTPGIHMRELSRVVHVSLTGVAHHARILEMDGKVVGISDGHYRRYFLSTLVLPNEARTLTDDERRLLAESKRPTSLAIILNLAVDGPLRHHEIERRVGRRKGTVSFHLSRLLSNGVVRVLPGSPPEGYSLANPDRVISLLVTFAGSLRDHKDAFANLWALLERSQP